VTQLLPNTADAVTSIPIVSGIFAFTNLQTVIRTYTVSQNGNTTLLSIY